MTIDELINELEEWKQRWGNLEVRIAYQYNYPLALNVASVNVVDKDEDDIDHTCEEDSECDCPKPPAILWIATNDRHTEPYAPRQAWGD